MQKKNTREKKQSQKGNIKQPVSKIPVQNNLKIARQLGLLVALFAFLLYANTLKHSYALDDYSLIKENTLTRQGSKAIPEIFKSSYRSGYINTDTELYRPLSKAMFAWEWQLTPDNPATNHWINVLLFALTGYLLLVTLSKYFNGQILLCFIISAIFIAHPVHTEVVANIKSRDELLCFLFIVATLYFVYNYIATNKKTPLIISGICFFLAFLSKESAICFLFIIPLMLYFFTPATSRQKINVSILLAAIAGLFLLIRYNILKNGAGISAIAAIDNLLVAAPNFLTRITTAISILGLYLKLLLIPHPLVSDYSVNQLSLVAVSNWRFIISFILLAAAFIYAVIHFRKKSIISFGILYWFITMGLVSNIFFLIGTSFGERLLYTPSLGFCIVAGALLHRSLSKQQVPLTNLRSLLNGNGKLLLTLISILLLYTTKTISRNRDWKNNFTLYSQDVINSPKSARTHYYLGNHITQTDFLSENPDKKEAYLQQGLNELTLATEIYPSYADAYNQLGKIYLLKNDVPNSIKNYEKAIAINPQNALYLNNYGTVYFNTGKYDQALKLFTEAVKWNPNFSDAYSNIGCTYGQLKNFDAAIPAFQKAVIADPQNATAYYFMGLTYRFKGDEQAAQINLNKAYTIKPALKK